MEMLGNVLFISKEERTVDEAITNLERFYLNVETSWGNIFDYDMFIGYVAFNEDANTKNLEEAYKELNKAKEENAPEKELLFYQKRVNMLQALIHDDIVAFYNEDGCYVKDDIVYTAINLAGFWDVILPNPSCLLTDKQGNEVESCIYKDINFNENLFNNVTAIVWEDSDECLQLDYDYSYAHAYDDSDGRLCLRAATHEEMKERWINETKEILKKVIPDNYVRIIGYQKIHSRR